MPLQGGYSWHPGIPQTFLKIIHRGTTKKKEKNNENYARSQTKEWHMSGLLAQCVVYLDRAPMYVEIYQVYNKTKTCVLWFTIPSNSIILVLTHISLFRCYLHSVWCTWPEPPSRWRSTRRTAMPRPVCNSTKAHCPLCPCIFAMPLLASWKIWVSLGNCCVCAKRKNKKAIKNFYRM